MRKETILIATASAVSGILLILALTIRPWERPATEPVEAGTATSEVATPEGAAAEAGPPVEEGAAPPAEAETAEAPSFTSEQNRREVTLFFQEADSEFLGPERRKIFLTVSPTDQAKQIVVELINGPQEPGLLPTLPPQVRLRGLYLDRGGTAYVDLSSEVADLHPGGTGEEIATIYSLVNSLTYNLPEIKRVRLLVNGEERETLKNHLDLRRNYRKDLSIVNMDRKDAP